MFLFLILGCHEQPEIIKQTRLSMGTVFTITAYAPNTLETQSAFDAGFFEISRLETLMSPAEGSEIALLNASAGKDPVFLSTEVLELLNYSKQLCLITDGGMDITFGPLGRIWDFKADPFVPPTLDQIEQAKALVDCNKLVVDLDKGKASLPQGMSVGLGAIAKGLAVDQASKVLLEHGLENTIVDGGGDIFVRGTKAGKPWVVGIQDPRGAHGQLLAGLPVSDVSVVTSGDYERFATYEGVRYHHIINPKTGYPARGFISVTVKANTAEFADAISTGLFVAGPQDAGKILLQAQKIDPTVSAFAITDNGEHLNLGLEF